MSDFTIYCCGRVYEGDDGQTIDLDVPLVPTSTIANSTFRFVIEAEDTATLNEWSLSSLEPLTITPAWTLFSSSPAKPLAIVDFGQIAKKIGDVGEATFFSGGPVITQTTPATTMKVAVGGKSIRVVFHFLPADGTSVPPLSWMSAVSAFDLQWDLDTGRLRTASMATLIDGLKQGSFVTFAVLPYLLGALATNTDLTALSLVIRPTVDGNSLGTFVVDSTAIDWVDLTGGNGYYRVAFNLSGASITTEFQFLNDNVLDVAATGTPTDINAAVAAASKIACQLELRATHTSGVFTSRTIPLTILQALTP